MYCTDVSVLLKFEADVRVDASRCVPMNYVKLPILNCLDTYVHMALPQTYIIWCIDSEDKGNRLKETVTDNRFM